MTPQVVRIARVVEVLPDEFAVMIADAAAEGVRNMALLATEFGSASDPFVEPGAALFAAFIDGDLTGVGGVTVEAGLTEPAMRLRRLYVRPRFRRAGVARALAGAMMQQGFQTAPLLIVNARATAAAGPFWEAMGFTPVDWRGVTHALRLSLPVCSP
ncbi:MAG: GNAT family N-acetyltransferase [Caulobacter sp.]|nr:GNAT family N-acetyltransferase [Caulobacter sp.]